MRRARGGEGGAGRRRPLLGAWRSGSARRTDMRARAGRDARQRAGTGRGRAREERCGEREKRGALVGDEGEFRVGDGRKGGEVEQVVG